MTPVVAHLNTLSDLLQQGPAPTERRRLLANRSRVSTLAGRLAFFDLQDPMLARAYYNLALDAAREAGDHLQAAAALGHVAFIPAAEYGFAAALDYVHGAAHHVAREPHGPVASWLAAVESEMYTNTGNPTAALTAVDRARDELAAPGLGPRPALVRLLRRHPPRRLRWVRHAARRPARRGRRRAAHRARQAAPRRRQAARGVPRRPATVELHDGDLDHACRIASEAADQLHQAGYGTGAGRLRELRTALDPWQKTAPVRALDEQLATLA